MSDQTPDPGVKEGTVLETPEGTPNESVFLDKDEDGNVVGWHKEALQ